MHRCMYNYRWDDRPRSNMHILHLRTRKKNKIAAYESSRHTTNKVDFRSAICWVNYDPMVSLAAVHL